MRARPLYSYKGKRKVFIIQSTDGQVELDLFFVTRGLAAEHIQNNDYDENWFIGEYILSAKIFRSAPALPAIVPI